MARMEKQDKKMNKDDNDLIDKLVGINRVAKVCLLYTSPSPRDS